MAWEYALIGLAVGIIIGALAMKFYSNKLHRQKKTNNEFATEKKALEEYRQELTNHFAHSAKLLDNMAKDYHQLYQHMIQTSSDLLPGMSAQENPFSYRLAETDDDRISVEMPPRDYPEKASGLLHSKDR